MTQSHTPTFIIANKYDDRTWCSSNASWVNDGRATAHYATREAAKAELYYALADDETATVETYGVCGE